jgi:predicted metal-dependent hydrolase
MTYKLIRSNRKSIAIEVRAEGILVRAPLQATQAAITAFVNNKADWIKKAQAKIAAAPTPPPVENPLSMDEIRDLANQALKYIPERVRHYAPLVGVCFGRITIRNQRSRWGIGGKVPEKATPARYSTLSGLRDRGDSGEDGQGCCEEIAGT